MYVDSLGWFMSIRLDEVWKIFVLSMCAIASACSSRSSAGVVIGMRVGVVVVEEEEEEEEASTTVGAIWR
jgi:hypothetical protein